MNNENLFRPIKLNSWNGVGAGQRATLEVTQGGTYERFFTNFTGVTPAQMKNLELVLNGKTIQKWPTVADMLIANGFDRMTAHSGMFVWEMGRYGVEDRALREMTYIGGLGRPAEQGRIPLTSMILRMDIDSAATNPTLETYAVTSRSRPLGMLKYLREFNKAASGAGPLQITDLPKGHLYNRMFFHTTTDAINELVIEREGYVAFERPKLLNSQAQRDGVRTPQTNWYVWDSTESGLGDAFMQTAGIGDLKLTLDMAGASQVKILLESLARIR